MTSQKIDVSNGATEYTWPVTITETTGKDISTDTIQISLGTANTPGTWTTGVLTRPAASSATVKLLVTNSVTPGTYYVWVKVADSPEIIPRKAHRVTVT